MSDQSKQTDISQPEKKEFQKHLDQPYIRDGYKGSDKLKDKVAVITGGDSGIGRAVAVHYAREGADVAIVYLESDDDAEKTQKLVAAEGRKCILFRGDVSNGSFCKDVIQQVVKQFGKLNILVNNGESTGSFSMSSHWQRSKTIRYWNLKYRLADIYFAQR